MKISQINILESNNRNLYNSQFIGNKSNNKYDVFFGNKENVRNITNDSSSVDNADIKTLNISRLGYISRLINSNKD